MEYNAAGWMTRRIVPGVGTYGSDTVQFFYNSGGQAIDIWSNFAKIERTYNERGALTWEQEELRTTVKMHTANGYFYLWQPVQRSHRYDRDGRRRASYPLPPTDYLYCEAIPNDFSCGGGDAAVYSDSIGYGYDSRGHIATIWNTLWHSETSAQNIVWSYGWDEGGRLRTLTVPLPAST